MKIVSRTEAIFECAAVSAEFPLLRGKRLESVTVISVVSAVSSSLTAAAAAVVVVVVVVVDDVKVASPRRRRPC